MHEAEKLDEAKHFLSRMAVSIDNPNTFRFGLSAFLSAARSVLQYALKEAKTKGGEAWYQAQVTNNEVIRFFKDKRDTSIHVEPIVPTTNANVAITDCGQASECLSIMKVDEEGNTIREVTSKSPPPSAVPVTPPSISYCYTFSDWVGTEDVLDLSSKYLAALETVVMDGLANGFLTKSA